MYNNLKEDEKMEKKNGGLIVLVVILSSLVVGLGGFIIYDKFLISNDIEEKNDDTNADDKANKTNDSNDLEQVFSSLTSETSDERDFYLNKCTDKLQGKFCNVISLHDGWGIYFINNDNLYLGDLASKKLHKISGLDGVPIKVISGSYASDESRPVIGVLTNKGNGYITSANVENDSDATSSLISFTKITTGDKITDLALLQNYEIYRGENAYQGGSAMMFAKIGYQWKIVNTSNDNKKAELGQWLSEMNISQTQLEND